MYKRQDDDGSVQRFRVDCSELTIPEVALTFPGRHNALNATAALALATFAGAPIEACVAACADFRGPARRFEILGAAGGVTVVDDYAHHPTEVWAAINAARARYGRARIIAVHTPHTLSLIHISPRWLNTAISVDHGQWAPSLFR